MVFSTIVYIFVFYQIRLNLYKIYFGLERDRDCRL